MKVLMPVDVLEPYEDFVRNLSVLMPLDGTQVVLQYVENEDRWWDYAMYFLGAYPLEWKSWAKESAWSILGSIKREFAALGANAHCHVDEGDAHKAILERAENENVDVIILTPQHKTFMEKFLVGSVSNAVSRTAHRPVIILREIAESKLERVLFCIDGGEDSFLAMETVVRLLHLAEKKVAVTVVHVGEIPLPSANIYIHSPGAHLVQPTTQSLKANGTAFLDRAEKYLNGLGVDNVTKRLSHGDPATTLLTIIEEEDAQFVVTGTRNPNFLDKLLFGSVSEKILSEAPCSVAVVNSHS